MWLLDAIAVAGTVLDQFSRLAEFLPKAGNVNVNRSLQYETIVLPDFFQYFFP